MDIGSAVEGLFFGFMIALMILSLKDSVMGEFECLPQCVPDNVEEIASRTQAAQLGVVQTTNILCMNPGDSIVSEDIMGKVNDVYRLTFECPPALCMIDRPLKVTEISMTAVEESVFIMTVDCSISTVTPASYECVASVSQWR